MQVRHTPPDPDPRVTEIEAELTAYAARTGQAVSTICRKALGYSSWLMRLKAKRERDAEMIRVLREFMEAHDGVDGGRAEPAEPPTETIARD